MKHGDFRRQVYRVAAMRAALPRRGSALVRRSAEAEPAVASPVTIDYVRESSNSQLYEYWSILKRRAILIATLTIAGLGGGLALTIPQTSVYRASTALEIQGRNENFMNARDLDPTATSNPGYEDSYVETLVQILQGDSMLNRLVERLDLLQRPEYQAKAGIVSGLLNRVDPAHAEEKPMERARRLVRQNLRVNSARTNRIVELQVTSTDPQLAATMANTLADEFVKQYVEVRWHSTERTAEFLNEQLAETKKKLDASEEELAKYARYAEIVFTADNDTVATSKLRQLQEELSKAEVARVNKEAEFNMVSQSPLQSLPAVLDNPLLKDYESKLTDLKRQLAELTPIFKPNHYKVKQVQSQIEELEGALEQERGRIKRRIQNEFDSAKEQEGVLRRSFRAQTGKVSDQAAKAVRYNMLKREVDANRQMYDSILLRAKDARIAASMRASNIRVVDPAEAPSRPFRPNILLNSVIGGAFGFIFGVVFAIGSASAGRAKEIAERRIVGPGDSPMYLSVPELGVIPSSVERNGRSFPALLSGSGPLVTDGTPIELVTWSKQRSPEAESFRAIVASLLLTSGSAAVRVILVTSPQPREGKTTSASNLAIALAEVGSKVLLIDGDMRKPRMHTLHGVSAGPGLSDLLAEDEEARSKAASVIRETRVPRLHLLTAGTGPVPSAAALYSGRITVLLEEFRREYDIVIIDAPPMLNMADARFLGRLADGVILVVRSGETHQEAALASSRRLAEDGTRVLGTILNDWRPRTDGAYAAYGYYGESYFTEKQEQN